MFFLLFLQETQVPGLPCKWYTQSTIFGIPVNRLLKKRRTAHARPVTSGAYYVCQVALHSSPACVVTPCCQLHQECSLCR